LTLGPVLRAAAVKNYKIIIYTKIFFDHFLNTKEEEENSMLTSKT
jgi:hypothetical protein